MAQPDRILTVTTLKDTTENIERFVRRTLGSGVDHAVVFLDDDAPEAQAKLAGHPCVTVVRTDADYWHGDRPDVVMDRQMVNANIAAVAVAEVGSVRWLFHIDGDEALVFDRAALAAIDADAVRFRTLEAVAKRKWRRDEPEVFKRVPSFPELHALSALGLIDSPEVTSFFRGHTLGKTGVRPGPDVRFRIHSAYRLPDVHLEPALPDDMHLLHFESWCLDDFVARWQGYRPDRATERPFKDEQVGAAFYLINTDSSISEGERRRRLGRLFDELVADRRDVLRRFDLEVRLRRAPVEPRPLAAEDIRTLESALHRLCQEKKDDYRSTLLEGPKKAMRTV